MKPKMLSYKGDNCAESHVAILLATYNGELFIEQQLDSIIRQSHANWILYISDDGSTDATLSILYRYRKALGAEKIYIFDGPRQGFAQNFLSLIRHPKVAGDYFAFCDQDDIWFDDKLQRAVSALSKLSPEYPALYCSRTQLIDSVGKVTGDSPLFKREPSFRNALVQSLAGANTMMLNSIARKLLASVEPNAQVVSHDWLAYLLISGCGGRVVYDLEPTLSYRQHGSNLIGANGGLKARAVRMLKVFCGVFKKWNKDNIMVLDSFHDRLDSSSYKALKYFSSARSSNPVYRIYFLRKSGVYRQTWLDNIALITVALMGRI